MPTWLSLEFLSKILNYPILSLGDYTLSSYQLLLAITLFFVISFVSKLIQRTVARIVTRTNRLRPDQVYTFNRMIHYLMITAAILISGAALGLNYSKLTIIAGALSVGIGFGLQNIVNNFVSGIIILFEKSLKIGDLIELESGVFGEVIEINIRSTLIRTSDNVDILVPNSEFIGGRVTNWTLTEAVRRFRIPFGVAYGSDKHLVRKAALEAANSIPWTLNETAQDRIPKVWMTGFGESSLDFTLAVWVSPEVVKRPSSMISEYLWALDDAFRKYNIEVPFPQRDLYLKSMPVNTSLRGNHLPNEHLK